MWNLCGFSLVFSTFLIALIKFIDESEVSRCEMTYMYDEPRYIRIPLDRTLRSKYPAYNLYLYGEGAYANWLREGNHRGIPVLFLPGNSGSHKQVRSLASIALTKASKSGSSLHFNYFTIDFNEEFSAFYGKVLFRQTEYAAVCVKHILSLYRDRPNRPTSVLLVGHSMHLLGGVVARALLTLPHFDSSFVNVIITLAAPNFQPVAQPDPDIADFYDGVDSAWAEKSRAAELNRINLVSVGGGNRDLMVRSDLVRMPSSVASSRDIVTLTTSIPGVWTSADHLCIVWCNQLTLSIVRATFKLVDRETGQISSDASGRTAILREFLVGGTARAHKLALPEDGTTFVADASWTMAGSDRRRYSASSMLAPSSALLLPLKKAKDFVMVAAGFDMEPWIFECNDPQQLGGGSNTSEMSLCKVKEAFPRKSLYVPVGKTFWKVFTCGVECRRKTSNLVVKLPSEQRNVSIFAESFLMSDRSRNVTVWDLLLNDVGYDVPDKSIFFRVVLPDLTETWQAYSVVVHGSGNNCPARVGAIHFHVPWNNEDTFGVISKKPRTHAVHLFASKNLSSADDGRFPEIRFYLHPDCRFRIAVRFSFLDSLEQIIRFHLYRLPALLTVALLRMLSKQFAKLSETGECSSAWRSLSCYGDFGFLLKVYVLGAAYGTLSRAWSLPLLSPSSSVSTISAFFVVSFLYLASGAFLAMLGALGSLCAMASGKMLAVLLDCFRLTDNPKRSSWSLISVLGPMSLCALLVFISAKTCGSVSLLALQVISAIKLLHSHVRFWRSGPAREHGSKVVQCRLSVSFYLFWGMLFQLNCPAFIFWMKNVKYEQHLDPDPSFLPALLAILAFFGRGEGTSKRGSHQKRSYHILSVVQQLFAVAVLLFGLDRIYLTSWLLAFDAATITVWHWAIRFSAGEKDGPEAPPRRKVDGRREGVASKVEATT